MSLVDETLTGLTENDITAYSTNPTVEPHIIVNSDRTITVPNELRKIAVQYDHNIETVTFDCPRYWDNHDLSRMVVYINYMLPNGDTASYPAEDVVIDELDSNIMHFNWTISKNLTQYKGNITFLVCVKQTYSDGTEKRHWNSELCKDLIVSEGMECDNNAIFESDPDLVTSILTRLNELEQGSGESNKIYEYDNYEAYFDDLMDSDTGLLTKCKIGDIIIIHEDSFPHLIITNIIHPGPTPVEILTYEEVLDKISNNGYYEPTQTLRVDAITNNGLPKCSYVSINEIDNIQGNGIYYVYDSNMWITDILFHIQASVITPEGNQRSQMKMTCDGLSNSDSTMYVRYYRTKNGESTWTDWQSMGSSAGNNTGVPDVGTGNVEIIDNLESEDTGAALSANQGRILNEKNYELEGIVHSRNLLPLSYFHGLAWSLSGINYQKKEDGSIIATGTATANSNYVIVSNMPIKAGTYTLSGIPEPEDTRRMLQYKIGDGSYVITFKSGTLKLDIENDTTLSLRIWYQSGITVDEEWRVMLEEGETAHPFVTTKTPIKQLQDDISGLSVAYDVAQNTFSLYDDCTDGWIYTDGSHRTTGTYKITKRVFVKAGTKFKYKLKHGTAAPIIALFKTSDGNDLIESKNGEGSTVFEGEYTTENEGYICFVYHTSLLDGYVYFTEVMPDNVQAYVTNKIKGINSLDLNILCLGDSIFGNDGEIVQYLGELTGANVILGAIGGTSVSDRGGTDSFQYLDGQNLVQALTSGDWTNQDSAVTKLQDTYTWLPDRIQTLKSLDMSTIDLITMNWGTNDYTQGKTIQQILDAYTVVIDSLQSAYPELRILILTPTWRFFDDAADGSKVNGDNLVYTEKGGDATLKQIAESIEDLAKNKRISVLNAYQNMPLSYNTALTYFDARTDGTQDGVHLNAKGNMVYAHLLNGKIRSLY